MAARTLLNLGLRGGAEADGKSLRCQLRPARRVIASVLRPGQMRLGRSMTALAADTDFRLGAPIPPCSWIEVFHEACCMALRAARVPVLVGPGPMQAIFRWDILVGLEMKPPLLFNIPSDIECLKPPLFHLKQILLQWRSPGH